ncbi:hypothetical protein C0J52_02275 [Blattella germanica]|nr:hypothetical protein C0J52_02275 [Blattella germanica]
METTKDTDRTSLCVHKFEDFPYSWKLPVQLALEGNETSNELTVPTYEIVSQQRILNVMDIFRLASPSNTLQ